MWLAECYTFLKDVACMFKEQGWAEQDRVWGMWVGELAVTGLASVLLL